MEIRKGIDVHGIVQGVGFRPTVHRLATSLRLAGTIANTAGGVTIEVQGRADSVQAFVARLSAEAPPLARITGVRERDLPVAPADAFRIVASRDGARHTAVVPPDVGVCDDCRREMFDPGDRRYRHAFISCTNCGPRFTIVRDIPYDRPRTSMAEFAMCPACDAEYRDPGNRRFHAQTIACPDCGPRVALCDVEGNPVSGTDAIAMAAARLREGSILALKGLGGFHLAVDATNDGAVARLRERKGRGAKPFAIMVPDTAHVESLCVVDEAARHVLEGPEQPIVLLRRKHPSPIAPDVAPGIAELGVILPYTPLHHLLLADGGFEALVMTSGNRSEDPIASNNADALSRLHGIADVFLMHDRAILHRCDDSVVRVSGGRLRPVRSSRGLVPVPIPLGFETEPILAVGGEFKNTVCVTRGGNAFASQHVGDLEHVETREFFEEAVDHLTRLIGVAPRVVAHDLHPDYFATRWARARADARAIGVQHHHAHIAACMAEHRLEGRVLGLALDGTGYGSDGRIWGGELLAAGYADFTRIAHLEYAPMPGGEAAIREPWRMASGFLAAHFGEGLLDLPLPFATKLGGGRGRVLLQMVKRRINAPLTSSCGRLFDAVAALAGVRDRVTYEAQAAIELEASIAHGDEVAPYPFAITPSERGWIIGTRPLFEALLEDLRCAVPAGTVSRRFHDGLIATFSQVAALARQRTGLHRVCLSGGCFANPYLAKGLERALSQADLEVFTHRAVPAGDGGLSLGQAAVAAHRIAAG
ncbi:MAG: carbamoyltransferase HypF [Planctomycetota bacterium]|jgi:hydrogenase maturation protein HypF